MRRVPYAALLFALALGVSALPAEAGTITVTTTAQSPGGTGDCTLGEAITAANTDATVDGCAAGSGSDTIQLPAGTYTLTAADNNSGQFGAPLGVPAIASVVIIEGQTGIAGDVILERASGGPEFIFTNVASGSLTMRHLTVRQFGAPTGFEGGAITIGTAIIENCIFSGNVGRGRGGAITSTGFGGSLTVTDSSFDGNTAAAGSNGGAILVNLGPLTVSNSLFTGNTAGGNGGAIHVFGGTGHTIADSTFDGNSAGVGGAINVAGTGAFGPTSLQITRAVFVNNINNAGGNGGGAVAAAGTLTVIDSLFTSNHEVAGGSGGAIYGAGSWTISGSTFEGNSAASGGALSNRGNSVAVVTVKNSTFTGNTATSQGGAIWQDITGTLNLRNVTITGNTAGTDGGGIAFNFNSQGLNIRNSIIAANSDTGNQSPDCFDGGGPITSEGYNLIGDGTGCGFPATTGDQVGTSGAPIDPLLGTIQDNNGILAGWSGAQLFVQTIPLLADSPALDAGNPSFPNGEAGDCEATDQRGVSRPLEADGDFNPLCDIGAVEQAAVNLALTKVDDTGGSAIDAGSALNYTINVTNLSGATATNVVMVDILPAGVTFVNATVTPVEQGSCSGTTTIICELGTLFVETGAQVDIAVTATTASTVVNVAGVAADEPDVNEQNNSAFVMTNVSAGCATAPGAYVSWLGGAGGNPDDWSVGANWRGGAVPTSIDNVYVCATAPNQPRLTANVSVADVFVENGGGSIDTNGFTLTASGNVVAGQTISGTGTLNMTGVSKTLIGSVPNLTVSGSGSVSASGGVTVSGNLSITGGSFSPATYTIDVSGNLSTSVNGILIMLNATDIVNVAGSANFSGGDERNKLTAGELRVAGGFIAACCVTFSASNTHLVHLNGTSTQTLNMANASAGGNRFQELVITNSAGLTLTNNVHALGNTSAFYTGLIPEPPFLPPGIPISGVGFTWTTGDFSMSVNSTLTLAELTVFGSLSVPSEGYAVGVTNFGGTGPQTMPLLPYQALAVLAGGDVAPVAGALVATSGLTVAGTLSLGGTTDIGGAVSINGSGDLVVNGQTLNVGSDLGSSVNGVLVMTNAADAVNVAGAATFLGGDSRNKLTTGALSVKGDFTVTCCVRFVASGAHRTVLEGTSVQVISMANAAVGGNHFQALEITNTAGITLVTDVHALGSTTVTNAIGLSGSSFDLTTDGFTMPGGGNLTLNGLSVGGVLAAPAAGYNVGTTTFTGTGPQSVPLLPYQNLSVAAAADVLATAGNLIATGALTTAGTMSLNGQTDVGTSVSITGSGALVVNGQTLNVGSDLSTSVNGVLVMTNAADAVNVAGAATFLGGDSRNQLTAGALSVKGDFTVTCCVRFVASGTHRMVLEGTSVQVISMANAAVGGNHFQALEITNTAGITLVTDVHALGSTTVTNAIGLSGSSFDLTTDGFTMPGGGNLTLNGLSVGGVLAAPAAGYNVGTTTFTGTGPQSVPLLPYQNLSVAAAADVLATAGNLIATGALTTAGTMSLNGRTDVGTSVSINGSGALVVNGQTLNVGSDLGTSVNGVLVMTNAADLVIVPGDATFNGGDSRNQLTNGVLRLRGNLTAPCCVRFVASSAHRTVFDGSSLSQQQNINVSNSTASGNKFHHLEIAHSTTLNVNLIDNVFAGGQLIVPSAVTPFIAGGFVTMTVSGLDVDGVTLQDVKLISNGGTITRFDNVTVFQGDGAATTLTIQHPGTASAFNFNNVQFQNTPTTGKFISATDSLADANVLTINMVNSSPADGTAFTQLGGGAVVNWGAAGPTQADLALQGITGPVPSGTNLLYSVQVKNNGPDTATGVVVTDTLTNFQLAAASASQGSCSAVAGTVSCALGTLASGATATVSVSVAANGAGWASHSFHASSASVDPDLSNNLKALTFGNREPKAIAGANQTFSGTGINGTPVALDGRGSSDPDGDALTYRWTGPFPEGGGTVTGATPTITLAFGSSTIVLVVSDGQVDSPAAEVSVVVTDFGLNAAGGVPIARGASATYAITVSSQHGAFDREVAFGCGNLPAFASCSFSPAVVTPNGTSATATLTIRTAVLVSAKPATQAPALWAFWYAVPVIGVLLVGRRRRRSSLLFVALVLLVLLGGLAACGGGGGDNLMKPAPPAPSLHTITVTGTSGALSHSTSVTLSVK